MSKEKEENIPVVFYGSLRPNHYNFFRIFGNKTDPYCNNKADVICNVDLFGYQLFDMGSYPAMVSVEDMMSKVVATVMFINKSAYNIIERMESDAGYDLVKIKINLDTKDNLNTNKEGATNELECTCFIYTGNINTFNRVKHGDWDIHMNKSKFLEEVKEYD